MDCRAVNLLGGADVAHKIRGDQDLCMGPSGRYAASKGQTTYDCAVAYRCLPAAATIQRHIAMTGVQAALDTSGLCLPRHHGLLQVKSDVSSFCTSGMAWSSTPLIPLTQLSAMQNGRTSLLRLSSDAKGSVGQTGDNWRHLCRYAASYLSHLICSSRS